MARAFLLDANLLIGAFDGEPGNEDHEAAKSRLAGLLRDPQVRLAITPLIRYEVLRGARHVSLDELSAALDDFQEFEIRGRDAYRAAQVFQQAARHGRPLDKRRFDVFHCVCAESNELEMLSQDSDIAAIRELME
ncbi:type II toxin-antitoxin system VapC family toxin [Kushneria aurantia]|uniref:Type II toxin-antitoxin system VapC family toxin n=1 Tax=Kushneria aurantia TaxID=504092 RepID=A0ABV6G6M5_9GAMM|nr:PIN domain-containing protein [Kushneria aurantia]